MKLTTRGFTLVELMIVIAIIGILAAALFPSMTGYLKRSRDAARASGLKDISTALGAYYSDKESYLSGGSLTPDAGCMASGSLSAEYMPKGTPQDPTKTKANYGCTNGRYVYASAAANAIPGFVLAAQFENTNGGNYNGVESDFQASGTMSGTAQQIQSMTSKGAGSGYLMTN